MSRAQWLSASLAGLAFVSAAVAAIFLWFGWSPAADSTPSQPEASRVASGSCAPVFRAMDRYAQDAVQARQQNPEDNSSFYFDSAGDPAATEMAGLACLQPFEVVILIEGLPGISGVYRSSELSMDLHGFGGSMENWAPGRCFVAGKDIPFQTNAVMSRVGGLLSADDLPPELVGLAQVAFTVDVGVSVGEGNPDGPQPFVGLVVQSEVTGGAGDQEVYDDGLVDPSGVPEGAGGAHFNLVSFARVKYNYVAALPDRNAEIEVDSKPKPSSANPYAGFVTFTSTFYDEMKFMNFINKEGPNLPVWEGYPLYVGRVSLWCGG